MAGAYKVDTAANSQDCDEERCEQSEITPLRISADGYLFALYAMGNLHFVSSKDPIRRTWKYGFVFP